MAATLVSASGPPAFLTDWATLVSASSPVALRYGSAEPRRTLSVAVAACVSCAQVYVLLGQPRAEPVE